MAFKRSTANGRKKVAKKKEEYLSEKALGKGSHLNYQHEQSLLTRGVVETGWQRRG